MSGRNVNRLWLYSRRYRSAALERQIRSWGEIDQEAESRKVEVRKPQRVSTEQENIEGDRRLSPKPVNLA